MTCYVLKWKKVPLSVSKTVTGNLRHWNRNISPYYQITNFRTYLRPGHSGTKFMTSLMIDRPMGRDDQWSTNWYRVKGVVIVPLLLLLLLRIVNVQTRGGFTYTTLGLEVTLPKTSTPKPFNNPVLTPLEDYPNHGKILVCLHSNGKDPYLWR